MRKQQWKSQRLLLLLQIFKLTKASGRIYDKFIFSEKQCFYKSYQTAMNKAVNHFIGLSNGTCISWNHAKKPRHFHWEDALTLSLL